MRARILTTLGFSLGRRGIVLVLFGVIYGLIGLGYLQGNISPTAEANLHLALRWIPIEVWGGVWFFAGVLAVVASHWPPGRDWWGYAVLCGLAIAWCAFCALGRLIYAAPFGLQGALVYLVFAAVLLVIAGWPEAR